MSKKILFILIVAVIHLLIGSKLLSLENVLVSNFRDPYLFFDSLFPPKPLLIFNIYILSWLYYLFLMRDFFQDFQWLSPLIILSFLFIIYLPFILTHRLLPFSPFRRLDASYIWSDIRFDLVHFFSILAVNLYLGLLVYKILRKTLFKTL